MLTESLSIPLPTRTGPLAPITCSVTNAFKSKTFQCLTKAIKEIFSIAVSWIYNSQILGTGPDLASYIILLAIKNKN